MSIRHTFKVYDGTEYSVSLYIQGDLLSKYFWTDPRTDLYGGAMNWPSLKFWLFVRFSYWHAMKGPRLNHKRRVAARAARRRQKRNAYE